jgi:hypothetical protein
MINVTICLSLHDAVPSLRRSTKAQSLTIQQARYQRQLMESTSMPVTHAMPNFGNCRVSATAYDLKPSLIG